MNRRSGIKGSKRGKMGKVAEILAFAACLSSATSSAHAFTWSNIQQQQAIQLIAQHRALRNIPSLAVSVTINGTPVFVDGSTPAGMTGPSGGNSLYQIGSLTKQFTAAGILALIQDQATVPSTHAPISLDTPLSDFFANVDHWSVGTPNTIRRLLTMTSNIPTYTADPRGVSTAPVTALDLLQRVKTYPLVGMPGEFDYSNTNYFLLSEIIDVVKGQHQPPTIPYRSYIRARIFSPAGMSSSSFIGDPPSPGTAVAAPTFLSEPRFNLPDWPKGAGDIRSTAADLARWNSALMSGAIINQNMLATMLLVAAPVPATSKYVGCSYGMGWFVCPMPGYLLYRHDGEISGFRASNVVGKKPNGMLMSVTVLANSDSAGDTMSQLARGIIQIGN
jgi:CubicO group peptidase (beta-lactamase class C family)